MGHKVRKSCDNCFKRADCLQRINLKTKVGEVAVVVDSTGGIVAENAFQTLVVMAKRLCADNCNDYVKGGIDDTF